MHYIAGFVIGYILGVAIHWALPVIVGILLILWAFTSS